MDVLFGATIASLFSGINHVFGSVKIQLSDILAIVTIFLAVLKGIASPRVSRITLITLLAYVLDYLLSALFVKLSMAAAKIAEFGIVFSFLFAVFGYYRTRSSERLLIISSVFISLILCANVGWHLAHGYYVGWKHLNEPKTIFILLPMLLILLFNRFPHFWKPPLPLCAVCVAAVIIFLSGERKAYIFAPIAFLVWIGPRKVWRYAVIPIAALPILWFAGASDQNSYLHRQVTSLQVLLSSEVTQDMSESQLMDASRPTTLSNAERVFTNRHAAAMWEKRPLLGIGTDAFEIWIQQEADIPVEFRLGIHGEFYRALYENGIVGLELYAAIWIVSFGCIVMMRPLTNTAGAPALNKIKFLSLVMFLIYSSFESYKELMVYVTCSLPFVLGIPPARTFDPRLWAVCQRRVSAADPVSHGSDSLDLT